MKDTFGKYFEDYMEYLDIYNEGDEFHESRWEMASVQWNISNYLSPWEVAKLVVIA